MTTPIMVPAKPEEKTFHFKYGISLGPRRFGMLAQAIDIDDASLPCLVYIDEARNISNFIFSGRKGKYIAFRRVPCVLNDTSSSQLPTFGRQVFITIDEWIQGTALYFDFMAAEEAEKNAKLGCEAPSYHILLDHFSPQGERRARQLIGSCFTRSGAMYALRQHSTWTRVLWEHWSINNAFWESAQSRDFDVVEDFAHPDQVQVRLTTSYPYSRGRRKPFTTVWRWHLSRQVPLVEAGTMSPEEADGERHERWTHRPGDPKILRETGTGLFGSFPSFEGDDEPEYQDER